MHIYIWKLEKSIKRKTISASYQPGIMIDPSVSELPLPPPSCWLPHLVLVSLAAVGVQVLKTSLAQFCCSLGELNTLQWLLSSPSTIPVSSWQVQSFRSLCIAAAFPVSWSDLSFNKDIYDCTVLCPDVPDFVTSGYFHTVYYPSHFLSTVYYNCSIFLLLLITYCA